MQGGSVSPRRSFTTPRLARHYSLSGWALAYVALPNLLFLVGYVAPRYGVPAGVAFALTLALVVSRTEGSGRAVPLGAAAIVLALSAAWTLFGGVGHFVYANLDWTVRDAVLLDLVRDPWPVVYDAMPGQAAMMLRAPIGYYLPAALIGKLLGIRAAELALLLWTACGVFLVFMLMLRDGPKPRQILVRLTVFIFFSGMDIVGTITHYKPYVLGDHLEWWAYLFQYSSHTTQLFWVPNHALPGWIAIAWLLGHEGKRLPIQAAILIVACAPLWSPLTAIGLAPIFAAAIVAQWWRDGNRKDFAAVLDWRVVVPVAILGAVVFPYLLLASASLASGMTFDVPWVGEDFAPRYVEFVVLEFALIAALVLRRREHRPLVVVATLVLLLLPFYRFGPANDLAMRASIPPLAVLAICMGRWLSLPYARTRDPGARLAAVLLLAVGAITPFMEFARVFVEPRWDMDTRHSLIEVTHGRASNYLAPRDQPWADIFFGSDAAH